MLRFEHYMDMSHSKHTDVLYHHIVHTQSTVLIDNLERYKLHFQIQRLRYAIPIHLNTASSIYHPLFDSLSASPMCWQLIPTIASPNPIDTSANTFGSL